MIILSQERALCGDLEPNENTTIHHVASNCGTLGKTSASIGTIGTLRRSGCQPECWDHFNALLHVTDTACSKMAVGSIAGQGRKAIEINPDWNIGW
jgi:hypothetical protein